MNELNIRSRIKQTNKHTEERANERTNGMSKCTTTATALAVATATAANRVCMCCAGFCESVYCTRFDCCCLCAYTFKWALFYVDVYFPQQRNIVLCHTFFSYIHSYSLSVCESRRLNELVYIYFHIHTCIKSNLNAMA